MEVVTKIGDTLISQENIGYYFSKLMGQDIYSFTMKTFCIKCKRCAVQNYSYVLGYVISLEKLKQEMLKEENFVKDLFYYNSNNLICPCKNILKFEYNFGSS